MNWKFWEKSKIKQQVNIPVETWHETRNKIIIKVYNDKDLMDKIDKISIGVR